MIDESNFSAAPEPETSASDPHRKLLIDPKIYQQLEFKYEEKSYELRERDIISIF